MAADKMLTIVVLDSGGIHLATFEAKCAPQIGEEIQIADRYGPVAEHRIHVVDKVRHVLRPSHDGSMVYDQVQVFVGRMVRRPF